MSSSESNPNPNPNSSPTAATTTTTMEATPKWHGTNPLFHYACFVPAILGPIYVFLPSPPGRHRAYRTFTNFGVSLGTFMALSQLAHDYTGKSIYQRSNERWSAFFSGVADTGLPERAARNRELIREERERRRRIQAEAEGKDYYREKDESINNGGVGGVGDAVKKLWMGEEKEGWKKKRLEEEKKALESGKGYGDLIWEQVLEVFGWGDKEKNKKGENDGEKKGEKKGE